MKTNKTNKTTETVTAVETVETAPAVETSEALTATQSTAVIYHFKNAKLNEASERIVKLAGQMESNRVEVAKVLGEVAATKCYEEDGFKSVSDYAEKVFGMETKNAYQLANVGKTFYNKDTDTAKRLCSMFSPSKLAAIASTSEADLKVALDSGEIHDGMTQDELKQAAKSIRERKNNGNNILKDYVVNGYLYHGADAREVAYDKVALEAMKLNLSDKYNFDPDKKVNLGPVKNEKGKTTGMKQIWIDTASGAILTFTATVYTKPIKQTASETDKLIAALMKIPAEQRAAILAGLTGADDEAVYEDEGDEG